jgi:ring-1,2-phenylacetyl-CoA epoxidase subunit PaaE
VWPRDNDRSSYWCFEREKRKESAIKFELFTASSHENVIQDLEGHTKITVMVDDEETTFEMSKQTLLEAALKQGLDALTPAKEEFAAAV